MTRKVILWSAPRCLSTVFYRSMATLKKTKIFQELFSVAYYYGPQRTNDMWLKQTDVQINIEGLSTDDFTYDNVIKILLADYQGLDLVFAKEHAHCLPEAMYEDILEGGLSDFIHTFLIRDPERALYSNYKTLLNSSVESLLDPPNGGLYDLYKLFRFIKEKKGVTPIVIDAKDLQTHPDETMKLYCEATKIQFDPKMTSWAPGPCPGQYEAWTSFNSVINQSSGFIKTNPEQQQPVPLNELPTEVVKHIEINRLQYKQIQQFCIKPVF